MRKFVPSRFATILYAMAMGSFGVIHFMNTDAMSLMVPDYMPGNPKVWVYVSGSVFLITAFSVIIKWHTRTACYLLAAMLLTFVLLLHLKPALDGNLGNLLKDSALAMAAIIIGNNAK
jgi:putative oxidoreductase